MAGITKTSTVVRCDLCDDTKSHAIQDCGLCGRAVCDKHAVTVGFRHRVPVWYMQKIMRARGLEPRTSRNEYSMSVGVVCLDCSKEPLTDVVDRLRAAKEAKFRESS